MVGLTLASLTTLEVGCGDSTAAGGGNVLTVASLGDRTISFWRYSLWWRNLDTQASKISWDLIWGERRRQLVSHPTTCSPLLNTKCSNCWDLQVVNVLLGVQVDATGPFLYGHYREAHINAAVKFPFLDLRQTGWQGCYVKVSQIDFHFILLSHPQATKTKKNQKVMKGF